MGGMAVTLYLDMLKYTFFHRNDFPPSYLHDQEPPETRAFSGDIPFVPVSPLLNAGSSTRIFLFFSTNWETCLLGTIHSTRYYPHSTLHWGPIYIYTPHTVLVPTQFKAIQLVVAIAVWAIPGGLSITYRSYFSIMHQNNVILLLDNNALFLLGNIVL